MRDHPQTMAMQQLQGSGAGQMSEEEYLGDGLYASFDGYMFTLRAPRSDGEHWIALEPEVMGAFDEYRKRTLSNAAMTRSKQELARQVVDANARIEALEAALRVFADPLSWRLDGSCDPNSGRFEGRSIARAALAPEQDK